MCQMLVQHSGLTYDCVYVRKKQLTKIPFSFRRTLIIVWRTVNNDKELHVRDQANAFCRHVYHLISFTPLPSYSVQILPPFHGWRNRIGRSGGTRMQPWFWFQSLDIQPQSSTSLPKKRQKTRCQFSCMYDLPPGVEEEEAHEDHRLTPGVAKDSPLDTTK